MSFQSGCAINILAASCWTSVLRVLADTRGTYAPASFAEGDPAVLIHGEVAF